MLENCPLSRFDDACSGGGWKIRVRSRVRNDITEPDKRHAAGKDSRASSDLSRAVARCVPVESNAGREKRPGIWQPALINYFRPIVFIEGRETSRVRVINRIREILRHIDSYTISELEPVACKELILEVEGYLSHVKELSLKRSGADHRGEIDLVRPCGRAHEVGDRIEPRSSRIRHREESMAEEVEGVEEAEIFVIGAEGVCVLATEIAEVVGRLEHVLVENVVYRERLVAERCVSDPSLADFDCREILAERRALITEAVIAHEEAIGETRPSSVMLESQ